MGQWLTLSPAMPLSRSGLSRESTRVDAHLARLRDYSHSRGKGWLFTMPSTRDGQEERVSRLKLCGVNLPAWKPCRRAERLRHSLIIPLDYWIWRLARSASPPIGCIPRGDEIAHPTVAQCPRNLCARRPPPAGRYRRSQLLYLISSGKQSPIILVSG